MSGFDYAIVEDAAKEIYIRALKYLPPDVTTSLQRAHAAESNATAREILSTILENIEVAEREDLLVCQDTGLPVYMVTIGSGLPVDGARVADALRAGAERATLEYPFRGSSTHPLTRINPQTSVGPGLPVIHWDFDGSADTLELLIVPKGSGSEKQDFSGIKFA